MGKEDIEKDIRRVEEETDNKINQFDYDRLGEYPLDKIEETFGSWDEALKEAEIGRTQEKVEREKEWRVSTSRLLSDMRKAARKADIPFTSKKYEEMGEHSPITIKSRFDSWEEACQEADIREIEIEKAAERGEYLASKIGIGDEIMEDFKRYLREYEGFIREKQVLGAFFCSMKKNNQPYSMKEIAGQLGGFDKQDIYEGYREVMESIGTYISPPPLKAFTDRYCDELSLGEDVRESAARMAEEVARRDSTPRTMAAALVYKAANERDEELTQSEVAKVAKTTQVTIRKNVNKAEEEI